MKIDNEHQRALLMQVIKSVPVSGTYEQVREAVAQLDALIKAIQDAEVFQIA